MAAVGEAGPKPVRVGMISLGCAKNLVDGEVMLGHLVRSGVEVTSEAAEADVVIVNTCGFIDDAKQESVNAILEVAQARAEGSLRRLVVSGCMAQAYARDLRQEIPQIDAFVGLDELERIVEAVRGEIEGHAPDQRAAVRVYDHSQPRLLSTGVFAYLKVAEGCDNPCAFCHIPAMRGAFRSRPVEDLVAEAKDLETRGVQEVVLIAQDTTRYGEDLGMAEGLNRLVAALLEGTAIPWIRLMYAYPATLGESLLELMGREPRFVPYLDLPLQHASRAVLKAMRRGGDARSYEAMIDRARQAVPDLAVRTTFIVGFPGEGEAEFAELEEFVDRVQFDHAGVFTYSWQEENPGAHLGDPVADEVKQMRMCRLMELQQEISRARNEALVGRKLPALVAGPLAEMELLTEARLQRHAPEVDGRLLLNDGPVPPAGSLVLAEITEAHPYDLIGRTIRVEVQARGTGVALPVVG